MFWWILLLSYLSIAPSSMMSPKGWEVTASFLVEAVTESRIIKLDLILGTIFFLTFLLLVMGGLLAGWAVKNCSHCDSELIPRNTGMSPFLRVSPAMVLILLSGVCWKLVQDSNIRFTTCVFTIGISALILLIFIYFRRKCIKTTFRACHSFGRKPDLCVKQFFSYR